MAIGTINRRNKTVQIQGGNVKIGEQAFYRDSHLSWSEDCKILNIVETNPVVKVGYDHGIIVIIQQDGLDFPSEVEPTDLYTQKSLAKAVEIANGKTTTVGSSVFVWRKCGPYFSLVSKKVAETNPARGTLRCTYADKYWPRIESPTRCFATAKEAEEGRPSRGTEIGRMWVKRKK